VLGTGRARDLSQDVAEDVPRRRRPTASARRQRVTQMAEDVAEDVPQLAEDVPDASDGSPERTGVVDAAESDGVASDGIAADDEGFPGGPRDPSVLIGFVDHVAHSIWRGQVRTYFIPVIRK